MIFGATGDLSNRKLLPAIYNLAHEGALPERFHLIGVSRSDMSDEEFRKQAEASIKQFSRREPDPKVLEALLGDLRYLPGTFDDDDVFERLSQALDEFDREAGRPLNRCFYLSTAPAFFPVIVGKLGEHRLVAKRTPRSASSSRSRSARRSRRPRRSTRPSCRSSPRTRSSASTTTWARRPSRT